MEFPDVVRRRRMVRRYDPTRGVPRETVTALLELAVQAPSAGFSQGWGFLILDSRVDLDLYWSLTARAPESGGSGGRRTSRGGEDAWLAGMRTAPVVLLALSDPAAYARRYARPDKSRSPLAVTGPIADAHRSPGEGAGSGSGAGSGATAHSGADSGAEGGSDAVSAATPDWPVAWWDVDTGMAALLLLLAATDIGLGGCLAGIPADRWDAVRDAFAVPTHLRPVGLVTLGHPAPGATGGRGRTRRPVSEVAHFGRWPDIPEAPTAPT